MVICRICKNTNLIKFLSLGKTPLANRFLTKDELNSTEPFFPLELYFCEKCRLVQLGYVVPPEEMYSNYLYVPSTSETLVEHFASLAKEVIEKFSLSKNDLVVDIGGNDGTLLKNFKNIGMRILNVEPATNIAKIAEKIGIETLSDYFTYTTANKILKEKGKAKIIIGTNVFTHIDDLDDFLSGINLLLDENGVFIIEVYYLGDIVQNLSFDIIYHEHLSYFTLHSLSNLFKKFDMEIFDIKKIPIHGGSIRVFICKKNVYKIESSVNEMLDMEKINGLDSLDTYIDFSRKVQSLKEDLVTLLKNLKAEDKKIVGYGAPAKSTTLLNYFGIGKDTLDYIVDKSSLKQNHYTPCTHIPILPPGKLIEDKPDYVLLLAWNFADEIMKQQAKYKEMGGKFIIPIPEPMVIG